MFNHVGDDAIQQRAAAVQARIGVDFNQPWLEVTINHEIQPKYLKVVHLPLRCDSTGHTFGCIHSHDLHLADNLPFEVVFAFRKTIEIILKLRIGNFVVGFISPILRVLFLNGIVGEMDLWFKVVYIEQIG